MHKSARHGRIVKPPGAAADVNRMSRRRVFIVAGVFLVVWAAEIGADIQSWSGVSWSHMQARDVGGLVFLAALALVYLWP